MKIWGLTGGIGSGKSAVTERLRARGVPVFDADEASRELLQPGAPLHAAVAAAFGPAVRRPDGALDRPALARLVFADPAARRRLEALVHPAVDARLRAWLSARAAEGRPLAFYAAPLLLEIGADAGLDGVVVVLADEETRVRRVAARDRVEPEAVRARMRAQLSDAERTARAGRTLRNDGTPAELHAAVDALLASLGYTDPHREEADAEPT